MGRAGGEQLSIALRRSPGLTTREPEVLGLIARGATTRELAAELDLSPRTIARQIANIYVKIDAKGKAEATAYALRHGLIP